MHDARATLLEHGTSEPVKDVMIPREERQRLVGLDAYGDLEDTIRQRERAMLES
jgi:hypothetical protein